MIFSLKNASATFQHLMDKVFEKQIGKNVEVYVDDILVWSKKAMDHLSDLQEAFYNLSQVSLKLKAKKCAFGVTDGKFLGYMITKEGIKPHLQKVQTILCMEPPKTIKDVQRLNGNVAALSRFIPRCVDRCKHFFHLLKVEKRTVQWTKACDKAFSQFKNNCYNCLCSKY